MKKLYLWLLMLGMVILVCAGLVIASEYYLRAYWPSRSSIYMPDATAIARYKPGIHAMREVNGKPVLFETNRQGIRHHEDLDPRDADVLLLGDSNVAALFLPFNQTLGQRLQSRLEPPVRVADLSLSGYGPDQSARRYIPIAEGSRAKAVVFHVFADNDFGDLFRNNLYRQSESGTWQTRRDIDRDPMLIWDRFKLAQRLWTLLGLSVESFNTLTGGPDYYNALHTYIGGTALHSLLPDALERLIRVSEQEYEMYREGKHTVWLGDHYDYGIAVAPHSEMAQQAERILAHVLTQAAAAFHGNRECFIVLIQPAEDDLMDYGGTSVSRVDLQQVSKDYYPRALTDMAIRTAQSAGLDYIDLFPVFSGSPWRYYFTERQRPMDNHWNSQGIGKAADLLADYLDKHKCLDRETE